MTEDILWGVQVHVTPAPVPWPQPAIMHFLVTAPTELDARQHALIAAGFLGRSVLVDPDYGSMAYAAEVPAT